jgi:sigma-B regulation protein RsbU (phosphoserine phosphatase)
MEGSKVRYLTTGCVGLGMLDEIPVINEGLVKIRTNTKLLCYTDGLIESTEDIQVDSHLHKVEDCISDNKPISISITHLISELNINKDNPTFFDDITILGFEFF